MYVVNASPDDATRTKLMDNFHKIITDHEGIIDKVDKWGVKEFAHEINHMRKGYYIVVNATTSNERIHEFERLARTNHSIARYMVIRTQDEE